MAEFFGWLAGAIVLGVYWSFVAPRMDRLPKLIKGTIIVVGGSLIVLLTAVVLYGWLLQALE